MLKGLAIVVAGVSLLAAGPALAQSVGVAAAVDQSAHGTPPGAKPRTIVLGNDIIHNEKIDTNTVGLLQILLADGTSFTVGPNSSIAIDSFVYDPSSGSAKVVATLGKGLFRFIGGKTSKTPGGVALNTPVGTVGIRGGITNLDFSGHGQPFHIDLLFGNSVTLSDHGQLLGNVFHSGYSIVVGADHHVTTIKTPAGWITSFQQGVTAAGSHHQQASGGHHVTVTNQQVASIFPPNGNYGPGPNGPVNPNETPTLASTTPPTTVPNDNTANWGQIYNSSLAGSYATYLGSYSYQYSSQNLSIPQNVQQQGTAPFSLDYYFGAGNGQGVASFGAPQGTNADPLTIPVSPDNPTSTGAASFGGHYGGTLDNYSAQLDVNGHFTNTADGVGHGVTGNFGFNASTPVTGPNNTTTTGTLSVNGTFNGNLDHNLAAP